MPNIGIKLNPHVPTHYLNVNPHTAHLPRKFSKLVIYLKLKLICVKFLNQTTYDAPKP